MPAIPIPLRILTIADLVWQNGHEHAIQAVAQLVARGAGVEYRIIGSGPMLEAVVWARHEYDLDTQITFLPRTGSIKASFKWGQVFLLAAIADGGTHDLKLAIAHGMPIVCTNLPSLAQQIPAAYPHRVAPRWNIAALADALDESVS